jgi:hypothetical protein
MSNRKKNRKGRNPRREAPKGRSRVTASFVFIALIILASAALAVAASLGGGKPVDCPPGQVWSDAHNHCH